MAMAASSLSSETVCSVYFQHWTGDIRFMSLSKNGTLGGGRKLETVITDARNSTPLSSIVVFSNYTVNVGIDGANF